MLLTFSSGDPVFMKFLFVSNDPIFSRLLNPAEPLNRMLNVLYL